MRLTLSERAEAYAAAFPKWRTSWPRVVAEADGRECMYAYWVIGNDYRNRTRYHGAYPRSYLPRVMSMYPDARAETTLHAFSGSVPEGPYYRCDMVQPADYQCPVSELHKVCGREFELILADPPYTKADAHKYGTPMVNRGAAMRALAFVATPGAHLVWLDTVWPMHRKAEWRTVGCITVRRSTNHVVRHATIFEREG